MTMLAFLLLAGCGYNSRFEVTYAGEARGALVLREDGDGWSGVEVVPEASVDFDALADGTFERPWGGSEPLDGAQRVQVRAWIDTTGALADGCDLAEPDVCVPGAEDPLGELEENAAPVSFNTWRLTLADPG